jgi:hypothetical protein
MTDTPAPITVGRAESRGWEAVGRTAVRSELLRSSEDLREEVNGVCYALIQGEQVTAGDVRAVRMADNELRRMVEMYLASVADDCEPWGSHVPSMPVSVWRRYGDRAAED